MWAVFSCSVICCRRCSSCFAFRVLRHPRRKPRRSHCLSVTLFPSRRQGKVIDVTSFLPDHPGGLKTLLKNGGKESTEVFEAFHRDGLLDKFIKNGTVKVVGKFA